MSTSTEAVVRHETTVDIPVDRAFEIFTTRFDRIKPHEQNLLDSPIAETVFEPYVGGSVYDRGEDGSICRWARVLAYDPPVRLLISWDIDPMWRIEEDHDRSSEVEIAFIAQGDARTRVQLEHRHIDRHGEGWAGIAASVSSEGGWPLWLQRYSALAV